MKRALAAIVVIAGLVGGAGAAHILKRAGSAPQALEQAVSYGEPRRLPEFSLVDQSGRGFDRQALLGHWTFLYFGFVNCPDLCPTTLATLADARRALADLPAREQPTVAFVSVDPGRDTPDALARYVAHFDPSFAGVTGDAAALRVITRALGVAAMIGPPDADGSYAVDHSAAIFLIDPEARAVALFGMPHVAGVIAHDYRRIVAAH